MPKQINVADDVGDVLTSLKEKYRCSYSEVLRTVIKHTKLEEINTINIVANFTIMQSQLPHEFYYDLEKVKALTLSLLKIEELEVRSRLLEEFLSKVSLIHDAIKEQMVQVEK